MQHVLYIPSGKMLGARVGTFSFISLFVVRKIKLSVMLHYSNTKVSK